MLAGTKHVLPKCARIMRLHGVLISIYIILVMFFSSFETIGVTCVLVVFCNFVFFFKYLHFMLRLPWAKKLG